MEFIASGAEVFMSVFSAGGEQFMAYITGIIPTLVCLMTAINSVIKLLGEEKVEVAARKLTKFSVTRYTILPVIAVICMGNPMCYSFGRFLDEKYKAAYYDAAVSFVHPVTGLFPHANASELFVYSGIAAGITDLGLGTGDLIVRYFIVGIIVIFIRGIVTERIFAMLSKNAQS